MTAQRGSTFNKSRRELALARKHYWWWRGIGSRAWIEKSGGNWRNKSDGDWAIGFKLWYERSAFLYELAARINGAFEFEKPWLKLNPYNRRILALRWPDLGFVGAIEFVGDLQVKPRQGWSSPHAVSLNLKLNDETLLRHLGNFIKEQRAELGINPKPNKGQRHRKLSWLPIELMDRQTDGDVMNDSERSQISKAKKFYAASI